ncbi:rhomboid family intramembrane serine protease [Schinkia sp. CFF1]
MYSSISQDQLFWRLAYELVTNHGYRVLKLNEHGEVWLELLELRDKKMIRLLRYDIDWGNWIERDIEQTSQVISKYKKQSNRKKMKAYNIYFSTYPPVDDWGHQVDNSNVETILIELGNREAELSKLFKQLNLPVTDLKSLLASDEDPVFFMQAIRRTEKMRIQAEKNLLFANKPSLTYGLVAVNVIMFLLLEWVGSSTDIETLIKFGAKYNPLILAGDWWRFITPMFLHIGFLHLAMNMMALYYLGLSVERIFGTWRFSLIYFAAGIAGAVSSFAFSTSVSAGASGAIFGCFGALLYFGVVHPSLFYRTMGANIFGVLAINLAFGFLVPVVDNSAHIGGLIGGFLASAIVHLPKHKLLIGRQIGAFLLLFFITAAALYFGFRG